MRSVLGLALAAIAAFPLCAAASEATLFVSPAHQTVSVGERFNVTINADTGGTPINAAEAELKYDVGAVTVEKVSTEGSILTSWSTRPEVWTDTGVVRFAGWAGENYKGSSGLLLTITFRALRNTRGAIDIASGSLLAADGKGSNVVSRLISGIYNVKPGTAAPQSESVSEAEPAVLGAAASIAPPVFDKPRDTYVAGESIVLRGYGAPEANILVHWKHGDSVERGESVRSSGSGDFEFALSDPEEGVYRIWAEAEDAHGLRSDPSEKVVVNVRSGGLKQTAASALAVAKTVIPLVLGLIAIGIFVGYLLHRRSRTRQP